MAQPTETADVLHEGPWAFRICGQGPRAYAVVAGHEDVPRTLSIPRQLGGLAVREVGPEAFAGAAQLREVDLPEGLRAIGPRAFAKTGLEWLAVPPSVRSIGAGAFARCRKLVDVGFEEGLESIGQAAFSGAPLRYLELPASLACIEGLPFSQGGAAGGWHFKLTVHEGNPRFFSDGHALYERTPAGCTLRWHWAVEAACTLRPDCTAIAPGAFRNQTMLRALQLPEGLASIGERACAGCSRLYKAPLPDGLREIGQEAFYGTKLAEVRLGPGLSTLGARAFARHASEQVAWPALQVSEGNARFLQKDGLLLQRREGGLRALGMCGPCSWLAMPPSVTQVAGLCFAGAPLRRLQLPVGLQSLEEGAFSGMEALQELLVPCPRFGTAPVRVAFFGGKRSAELVSACVREPGADGCPFDFAAYDAFLLGEGRLRELGAEPFARMALARLRQPCQLAADARERLVELLAPSAARLCQVFACSHEFACVEQLVACGLANSATMDAALRELRRKQDVEGSAQLMQLARKCFGHAGPDLSL